MAGLRREFASLDPRGSDAFNCSLVSKAFLTRLAPRFLPPNLRLVKGDLHVLHAAA